MVGKHTTMIATPSRRGWWHRHGEWQPARAAWLSTLSLRTTTTTPRQATSVAGLALDVVAAGVVGAVVGWPGGFHGGQCGIKKTKKVMSDVGYL